MHSLVSNSELISAQKRTLSRIYESAKRSLNPSQQDEQSIADSLREDEDNEECGNILESEDMNPLEFENSEDDVVDPHRRVGIIQSKIEAHQLAGDEQSLLRKRDNKASLKYANF